MNKLSKRSQTIIDDFGDAAKQHGWAEDQGVGGSVDAAREGYDASKKVLERHIARLEAKVEKAKGLVQPDHQPNYDGTDSR